VKMLFLLQFFYSTVTSRSWLTCWKWTAMMTLRFHQQNRVDGDGSWWRFLWPFFCGFDSSILQGFYVGLVQNMRFRCGNLVKTRWKKTFQLLCVS
jgi:hypothetical protein